MKQGVFAALAAAVLLGSAPARANMIISVAPVNVAAGTNNAALEIDITNNGPSDQNIAAFDIGLSVSDPGVTFTGGDESTTQTYIFDGDSFDALNSFAYTTVPPPNGQTVEGSDDSNSGNGTDVAVSATFGLGDIQFNVAPGTSAGPITVTLDTDCVNPNACTSLSDSLGNDVSFGVTNGSITVTGASSTPEPSTMLLVLSVLGAFVGAAAKITERPNRDMRR